MSALVPVWRHVEQLFEATWAPPVRLLDPPTVAPSPRMDVIPPSPYVIDTMTVTGKLSTTAVDVQLLYQAADLTRWPSLFSIHWQKAPTRTLYPLQAKPKNGFKHQASLVVVVQQRAVNVKVFCNGRVNVVGTLNLAQARTAVEYVAQIVAHTHRWVWRPRFELILLDGVPATQTHKARRLVTKTRQRHQMEMLQEARTFPDEGAPGTSLLDGQSLSEEQEQEFACLVAGARPVGWIRRLEKACSENEIDTLDLRITNIHCVWDLHMTLDRQRLFYLLQEAPWKEEFRTQFQPDRFPGVKWQNAQGPGTAFVFQQGKVVMTGIPSEESLQHMYQRITTLVHMHWAELSL